MNVIEVSPQRDVGVVCFVPLHRDNREEARLRWIGKNNVSNIRVAVVDVDVKLVRARRLRVYRVVLSLAIPLRHSPAENDDPPS